LYQTRKRGTLEADLLLSTFGNEWLSKMDEKELKELDEVGNYLPVLTTL
jgi:succinate dehydrogenase assembly factor 2